VHIHTYSRIHAPIYPYIGHELADDEDDSSVINTTNTTNNNNNNNTSDRHTATEGMTLSPMVKNI